jgi:phosphopantothenoylcysteine decarboxylase/phosphopantothenate--cysteine ligase
MYPGLMRCIVTAGPTYEELDQVRRLTNFSSGRLGSELASFLVEQGHSVTLLLGHYATWRPARPCGEVRAFSTTQNLLEQLRDAGGVDAIFHAAAVSDFKFGKIWTRNDSGELEEARAGKISTRDGSLLAELIPTPKILAQLRGWHPYARLIGWKYEVDGDRDSVIEKARRQIAECQTDACVANGPAYGAGFGLVGAANIEHMTGISELYPKLESFCR